MILGGNFAHQYQDRGAVQFLQTLCGVLVRKRRADHRQRLFANGRIALPETKHRGRNCRRGLECQLEWRVDRTVRWQVPPA
jgi:hypothetical protein